MHEPVARLPSERGIGSGETRARHRPVRHARRDHRAVIRGATALTLVLAVALAGCGPDRSRQQAVAMYFSNQTADEFGYSIDPETDPSIRRAIHQGVTRSGCGWLQNPWTLMVTEAPGKAGPDNPVRALLTTPDRAAREVAIWISIAPDGRIKSGQGVPDWWETDVQVCPSG